MSYASIEQSEYGGNPGELYRFALGTSTWCYTSCSEVCSYGGEIYNPSYIKRGGYTKGCDARKSNMEIEVKADNEVALLFRDGWLPGIMTVSVFRVHLDDVNAGGSLLWKGRVTGCKWAGSSAVINSESLFSIFQRSGLRRAYQTGCPHVLYGPACGLDADDWEVGLVASAVDGHELVVNHADDFADGYFRGGMLQHGEQTRMIIGHTGEAITLVDAISGMGPGSEVSLWPGCAHTVTACRDKFENVPNYGGLPYLPTKNPFSGDAVV